MSNVMTIRLDEDLKEKIKEKAAEDNRTINNWIVTQLQKAVEE